MKSTLTLSIFLAASLLAACNLTAGTPPGGQASPRDPTPISPPTSPGPARLPCLDSGDQNTINARLRGPGAVANLCPGALFELTGSVVISADSQEIYTEGFPSDDTRATLRIVSPDITTAVTMRDHNSAAIRNIIVDGNRAGLGIHAGEALIYAGGFSKGQIIRNSRIMDPRSWSALQFIQGYSESQPCVNAWVENNQIGPAGTSDDMQWADGISFTCTNSVVTRNVITDATDGGIVIFGAPGSVIEENTVRAETRTLLGGINMVDYDPYGGSYTATVVRNNVIDASGAVIRIGLGMGQRVWGCLPPDDVSHIIAGGTVTGNTLRGTHMQYGYAVDGVRDWTVTGNVDEATHTGTPSAPCGSLLASAPGGFLYNPAHSVGTFQPEFRAAQLDLALWAIVSPRPGE
jgi:hypothetical protein